VSWKKLGFWLLDWGFVLVMVGLVVIMGACYLYRLLSTR